MRARRRDRDVDHGDVADGSRIKRILAVRLDCFEEEELRIIDDAGDAECAECIDERLEGKELEALCARCHADECKDECKRIARADATINGMSLTVLEPLTDATTIMKKVKMPQMMAAQL